jgi:ribonuclease HIII
LRENLMADKLATNLAAFEKFIAEKGWAIWERKDIDYGHQVVITDGSTRLPVNFYTSGKILPQGKASDLKTAVTEWANLVQAGLLNKSTSPATSDSKNRIAKYLVIPDKITRIKGEVVGTKFENVVWRESTGPAELYRAEIHIGGQKATVTQYASGTLIVQGRSGECFDIVCEELDQHLSQSFAARAARFIEGDAQQAVTTPYLESAEAENEAAKWLFEHLERDVYNFLHENDRRTLVSAAGVRNAVQKSGQPLEDYSVVVMPFAKVYEGFMIRLAEHLGLADRQVLSRKSNTIEIGAWLDSIRNRLPDVKRYTEIADSLAAAWSCRNKSMHSDFAYSLSTLKSFAEAEQEISIILRAMGRAHRVFVVEALALLPIQSMKAQKQSSPAEPEAERHFPDVHQEQLRKKLESDGMPVEVRKNDPKCLWSITLKPDLLVFALRGPQNTIIVKGKQTDEFCVKYASYLQAVKPVQPSFRIGVDESGKGDLFGPLVVAGVALMPDAELELAKRGVRDSKTVSDLQIPELAAAVRKCCAVEVLMLLPPDYNRLYEEHGRNLNRLLAWGHAQVITKLSQRTNATRAISDQFGDEKLLIDALAAANCQIDLEQRPKAESDIAVAAASIVARAEFIAAIEDYSAKAGIEIPLGASAQQVTEIGKRIYKRWGRRGLERIAKMHFKTAVEIMNED